MIVTKLEERRKGFQRGVDFDEVRRKREEGSVQLRKVKRSEHIAKKRALTGKVAQSAEDTGDGLAFSPEFISPTLALLNPSLASEQLSDTERLDGVLSLLASATDLETLLATTEAIRKATSVEYNPPLVYIGRSAAAPKLVSLLSCENSDLLFNAVWCVTNLLSGPSDMAAQLVSFGLLPYLARLLNHPEEDIWDQAVWALSNVAGDSLELRDRVIQLGVGEFIRDRLMRTPLLHVGHIGNMIWLISNLVRGMPAPSDEFVESITMVIPKGLGMEKEEIVADVCWICSYITESGNRVGINRVIELRVLPKLVELMLDPRDKIQTPALRTLGNIATGDNSQMQAVLNLGFLDKLSVVLTSRKKVARKEALWCLSNVAAGSSEQVQMVLRSPSLKIAIQAFGDCDRDIRREAAWVLLNLANTKDEDVHHSLANLGCLQVLVMEMKQEDPRTLPIVLEAVGNVLKAHHTEGRSSEAEIAFEQLGGLSQLEKLQLYGNQKIYEKVVGMMDEFFGLMAVEEHSEAVVPSGGFQFT